MPISKEVERIFKLRQQFKECRVKNESSEQQNNLQPVKSKNTSGRLSEISDLIKKLKS